MHLEMVINVKFWSCQENFCVLKFLRQRQQNYNKVTTKHFE